MNLTIQHHGVPLPAGQAERIARRFLSALRRFTPRIQRTWIRVSDVNGPRGGVVKELRVRIGLRGAPEVQVVERCADLGAGAARAARRIVRVVARAIGRARTFLRS